MQNILIAFGLALLFIYPVLALFGEMLNLFSMIGIILLIGLVTKKINSYNRLCNSKNSRRYG